MNRAARKRQFDKKARKEIYERDSQWGNPCLFCRKRYRMEKARNFETGIFETMHVVPRSHGGLGVAKNGIIGCKYHHRMLDGSDKRDEMIEMIRQYMELLYSDWNLDELAYNKERDANSEPR